MSLTFLFSLLLTGSSLTTSAWAQSPLAPAPEIYKAGAYHACAVTEGQVRCWGSNKVGQTRVPHIRGELIDLAVGQNHNCALTTEGVQCWGYNWRGQRDVPRDLGQVDLIAAAFTHTCAAGSWGVRCWGENRWNQSSPPSDLGPIREMALGGYHSCVLTMDNEIRCWGDGAPKDTPQGLEQPHSLTSGLYHLCLMDGQKPICFGSNAENQLDMPQQLEKVDQIVAGGLHTCALWGNNQVVECWGNNNWKQSSVPALGSPVRLAAGGYCTCVWDAEYNNGDDLCWGMMGQLYQ